jgi:exodeoxyribonuclease V alpha subunit
MPPSDFQLDPKQREAVELIADAEFGVITGGPGTGKSTCLKQALAGVELPTHLIAPTGKAAVRMKEATGREAMTMHRFLGWKGGDVFERVDIQGNPLEPLGRCLIVVDEASMVDVRLAAALFKAAPEARIVFVGDVDQLPSVGPGSVLSDIIESKQAAVVRLETLHRAAQQSWVCRNAQRFNRGEPIELTATPGRDDFHFIDIKDNAFDAANAAVSTLADWKYDAPPVGDGNVQILIPQRRGGAGIWNVNEQVQMRLNPQPAEWAVSGGKGGHDFVLRAGDRVINKRNNYHANVMNGEMGVVVDIPYVGQDAPAVRVAFEGHEDPLTGASDVVSIPVYDLQLGYAITIHSAQGSQFAWVLVVCHSSHDYMLSRRLIYTAITRAQTGVILVGDHDGIERASTNNDDGHRKTRLKTMLTRDVA